jgi:hypothetical protein
MSISDENQKTEPLLEKFYQGSLVLLTVSFLIGIFIHAYIGSFSRFAADDFCSASLIKNENVFNAAYTTYVNWTGRFSANILDGIAGELGSEAAPFVIPFTLLLWLAVLVYAFASFEINIKKALLFSSLLLFTLLSFIPQVAQSVYWGQGMRSVVPPLILLTFYTGLARNSLRKLSHSAAYLTAAGVITFIAGGFSETYVFLQTGLLLACLAVILFSKKYLRLSPFLAVGAIGSIAAFLLIFFAPGNQARQVYFPPHPDLPGLISISARQCRLLIVNLIFPVTGDFLLEPPIANEFLLKGFAWIALLVIPIILTKGEASQEKFPVDTSPLIKPYLLFVLPLFVLFILLASVVPAAYAMSDSIPTRTLIIPYFFVFCIIIVWSYCAWNLIEQKVSLGKFKAVLTLSIILISINVFRINFKTYDRLPAFKQYAGYWKERDAQIRAAKLNGDNQVTVLAPPEEKNPYGLEDVTSNPEHWTNKCLFYYYDIKVKGN